MKEEQRSVTAEELCLTLGVQRPASVPAELVLSGINTLESASPNEIAFLARGKFRAKVAESKAALVLAPQNIETGDGRLLHVPHIWRAVVVGMKLFHPDPTPEAFIHPSASIAPTAQIGDKVWIGPYAVIADKAVIGDRTRIGAYSLIGDKTRIGADCLLHPRVTIQHECTIGNRVILHPGVVIGADGFRYEFYDMRLNKVPQIGNVVIEDDVEIGANSTIDRAGFASTKIGARTKIDNMVHIAHNCIVGSDCIIVGQVGIAGSCTIGRGVIIGGQVGVKDGTTIGDGSRIGARAAVKGIIPPKSELMWNPQMEASQYKKTMRVLLQLPDIYQQLKPLLKEQHLEPEPEDVD